MGKQKQIVWVGLLAVVSIGIGIWAGMQTQDTGTTGGYPDLGGDFTLMSDQGPVELTDFRGKVVPIYFGFTSCPDVCITSLTAIGAGLRQLTDAERAQVQPLFITIDPERDTPEKTGAYARYFHPDFIGLSGSLDEVTKVAKDHFVMFEKVRLDDSELGYTMDHSSIVYVVGRDGVVKTLIHHGESPENIARVLRETLAG